MGATWSLLFPPKATFSPNDIPDQSGKVMIVTGGNGGIGLPTVQALLNRNAKVYIATRNEQKALEAIADLRKQTGKEAQFIKMDLADLKSIKAGAKEFLSKEKELHVLFNVGGVMWPPIELLTKDGYDLQFGTNVLGHFYLTKLLLPTLLATEKQSPAGTVRVINVSSMGHLTAPGLDFASFRDGPERRKIGPTTLYMQSKFGNVVFSTELARRYGPDGLVSISMHPGNMKTELNRHTGTIAATLFTMFQYPAEMGALTPLYAGTMPEAGKYNGRYMNPWAILGEPKPETQDPETGKKLWNWLEEQVKDV